MPWRASIVALALLPGCACSETTRVVERDAPVRDAPAPRDTPPPFVGCPTDVFAWAGTIDGEDVADLAPVMRESLYCSGRGDFVLALRSPRGADVTIDVVASVPKDGEPPPGLAPMLSVVHAGRRTTGTFLLTDATTWAGEPSEEGHVAGTVDVASDGVALHGTVVLGYCGMVECRF